MHEAWLLYRMWLALTSKKHPPGIGVQKELYQPERGATSHVCVDVCVDHVYPILGLGGVLVFPLCSSLW